MKYVVQFCRAFVGILFILSGFVKAVDPIGFGYKLEEYFSPEVFDISFLYDLALAQATFFSLFEILLGIFLLLGIFRKFTVWSLLITIIFFTFLTFYSAYFNKVTDCGCFGDAMKLTPWQSFWKDVVLLVMILILFVGVKYIKPLCTNHKFNISLSVVLMLICVGISYTGIKYMPIIDFRAYAVGKSIPEGMKTAEELGLEGPKTEVYYTMQNSQTQEVVEITGTQYTNESKWYEEGTPWKMLTDKTRTVKISDGYMPPVKDFYFDCDGEDLTQEFLDADKAVLFIVPFADKVSDSDVEKLNQIYQTLHSKVKTIALVNSDLENAKFPYCFVDQTTLKTILRNNPGIMTLEKGVVNAKFHNNDLPTAEQILNSF